MMIVEMSYLMQIVIGFLKPIIFEKLAICKTDQFCYIDVVKFRVYPTHGGMVDLNISPMKNLSIILRPIPMSNIHFMLNQVVLTGKGWK
mgnify:CR=1 FL=1